MARRLLSKNSKKQPRNDVRGDSGTEIASQEQQEATSQRRDGGKWHGDCFVRTARSDLARTGQ
ncbi:MAG: hypothetical protein FWG98_06115 [Candidatus Cloacimonetes bacterium]|nr:hypothetical protein [Candidatus Cloacimonadota bacterium]